MALMTLQTIVDAGTEPTYSAANLNDTTGTVGNGHNTFLSVKNGGGASITVTIATFGVNDNGDALPTHVVTVAAAGAAKIPLRKSYDKGDGTGAQITYSAVTSVTSALVQVQ